ncbi:MAG: transglycosylase domain-containing protein, partial [Verrucomicrobium sp.]
MKTTDPTSEDKGTLSSAPGRMTFWRKRWVKLPLVVMAVVFGVAGAGALWLGKKYSERAARIDLSTLGRAAEGTAVLDRKGEPLGTLFDDNLGRVPLSDVPKHVVDALIATEDARFYEHRGVDYWGIGRAIVKNAMHLSVKQGGSTITQQLARQAFKLKGRTFDRKLLESFVARRIEDGYSKEQILEFYLNRIYLGHGFYGIGAAARGYFGKNVPDLTLEEGAVLVGIIKAPVPYSPFKDPQEARRVRDLTLKRMHSVEFIDGARLEAALASPVQVLSEKARLGRKNYVLAAVEQDLEEQAKKGRGGPWKSVRVTVDAGLQAHLDALVRKHVKAVEDQLQPVAAADGSNAPLQAAAVIIDNVTGEVLATCGGRDFASSPFDRVRQGQRPAGTAFIPLTYAAAYSLKPDLPGRQVLDAPMDNRRVMVGGEEGQLGEWGAEADAPRYEGYLPVPTALLLGKNGAAVRLAVEAGLEEVQARLQNGGF